MKLFSLERTLMPSNTYHDICETCQEYCEIVAIWRDADDIVAGVCFSCQEHIRDINVLAIQRQEFHA